MSERLSVGELRGKLRETRLRCLGHVARSEDTYDGRRVRSIKVGKRKLGRPKRKWGRPKRRWEDCVGGDMKEVGITEDMAAERKDWRGMIRTSDTT